MRLSLVVAVALLLAGCVAESVQPAATLPEVPVLSPDVVLHAADGSPVDPAALAEPIVAALREVGSAAFEPTLGVDADGVVFYAATGGRVAAGVRPLVLRSGDAGLTWEDVSPRIGPFEAPPETNDPYLYVDEATGRVFQFAMAPILVCSVLSWSDDKGETWTTNPRGCGNTPPWDHQAMVAARPTAGVTTRGYPNVLVQCVNNMVAANCARSLDGGLTWTPSLPVVVSPGCSGLHGHPVAHPDGTVYLPKMHCGEAMVYVSADSGMTWEERQVSDVPGQPWPDPAMAVDAAGNVYYAYVGEKGEMLLLVSADGGATWSEPVVASPPGLVTHLPALAAGDDGKVVLAYPGTMDLPKAFDSSDDEQKKAAWHGYLTLVEDALAAQPVFATARVTPADDPLVRGPCGPARCPGMTDFIDVVVGPDGRPYASFVDMCSPECAAEGEKGKNDGPVALLATLTGGPLLRSGVA